jgi:hypothetical protein
MCNTLGLLLFLTAVPGLQGGDSPGTTPFPGGVADPSGKVCYVQAVNGGIEAIDLKTGMPIWNTDAFARPLAVVGSKLLVQVPEKDKPWAVRIVTLDTANKGKQLATSDMIQFPKWVDVGVVHGRSFEARAILAMDKKLTLRWQATSFYAGGAPPPPPVEAAARREARGIAEVDLFAGKVKMMDDLQGGGLPKELENIKSVEYMTDLGFETKPLIVGNKVVTFDISQKGVFSAALTLQFWNIATAKLEKSVELHEGRSLSLMLTTDRRFLIVSEMGWWVGVFSLDSGKQVGKIPPVVRSNEIQCTDSSIFFVTDDTIAGPKGGQHSRTLKVVNAANWKIEWERAIYALPWLPAVQ